MGRTRSALMVAYPARVDVLGISDSANVSTMMATCASGLQSDHEWSNHIPWPRNSDGRPVPRPGYSDGKHVQRPEYSDFKYVPCPEYSDDKHVSSTGYNDGKHVSSPGYNDGKDLSLQRPGTQRR